MTDIIVICQNRLSYLLNILHYIYKVQFCIWLILLNLVHTGNLQFLAIFYNLAANEHGFLPKTSKISINIPT